MEICQKKYPHLAFSSAKQFVEWSYTEKYKYSYADMQSKSVRKRYKNAREITYRIENEDGPAGNSEADALVD